MRWVGGKRNQGRKKKEQTENSKASPETKDGRFWPGSAGIETSRLLLFLWQRALKVPGSLSPFPSGGKWRLPLPSFVPHPSLPSVFIARRPRGCHPEGLGGPGRVTRLLLPKPGGPHKMRGCWLVDDSCDGGGMELSPGPGAGRGGLELTRRGRNGAHRVHQPRVVPLLRPHRGSHVKLVSKLRQRRFREAESLALGRRSERRGAGAGRVWSVGDPRVCTHSPAGVCVQGSSLDGLEWGSGAGLPC